MNIDEIEKEADSMAPTEAMDFLLRELQKRGEIIEEFIALQQAFRRALAVTRNAPEGEGRG